MSCHAVQNHEYLRLMFARSLTVKHLVKLLYNQVNYELDGSYYAQELIEEARSLLTDYGLLIPDTYIYMNLIPSNAKVSIDHVVDLIQEALETDCKGLDRETMNKIAYSINGYRDIDEDVLRDCIGVIRHRLLEQHG